MAEKKDSSISINPTMKSGARLNRKIIAVVVAGICFAIVYSFMSGFEEKKKKKKADSTEKKQTTENRVPTSITNAPDNYDLYMKNMEDLMRQRLEAEYAQKKAEEKPLPLQPVVAEAAPLQPVSLKPVDDEDAKRQSALEKKRAEEMRRVYSSKILFTKGGGGLDGGDSDFDEEEPIKSAPLAETSQSANIGDAIYLSERLKRPVSPYELTAGSIIPAALITGINSDLPGQIIAQVHENIFDSVSGNFLLIPQGTRLIGTYDSQIVEGQNRVLLAWTHMIFPNGNSIALGSMSAGDLAGYAGVADKVNYHFGKLLTGAILSSFLSIAPGVSQGDVTGENPTIEQQVAEDFSSTANRTGQKIINDKFNLKPTIVVRPGYMFNVIVNKTIVLEPWTD